MAGFFPRAAVRAGWVVASLIAGGSSAALAQQIDCGRLQQQIASLGQAAANPRLGQIQAALQRQRAELDRTTAYSAQIGCGRRQFLFFGGSAPPQCPQIEGQIAQMQANVAQLSQSLAGLGGGGDAQRRDLQARFDAYCRGGVQNASQNPGFFGGLFGGGPGPAVLPPPDDGSGQPGDIIDNGAGDGVDSGPRGGSKAVCVRSCDGGFFPVSYSPGRGGLASLNELCHALCPNAEATLFTYSPGRDISTAVSIDGRPYSSLPNALKFRTKYDPTCTCKAGDKSWAAQLAEAEFLLGQMGKGGAVITPQQAIELSKPKSDVAPVPKGGKVAAVPAKPDAAVADGAIGAQAPTASGDSAGIASGTSSTGRVYSETDGQVRQAVGPDGVKKTVRVVGPAL